MSTLLTLCMIVKNEAALLPRCLASVRGVADELVIVDTGSTDETIAIAQAHAARVYAFPWGDDFAAARNASLKHATGDWILVLDADETLRSPIIPTLKQVLQLNDVLLVNLLRQEVGTQLPDSLVSRLFRNHPDIKFSRPYHELVDDSVTAMIQRELKWRVVELPELAIEHTGYQSDAIAQRRKTERARTIMESYLASHPNDAYICNKLGALYVDSGAVEPGIALLQQGLRSTQVEPATLSELHYHLGSTYQQLQQPTQAEQHYRAAIAQPISVTLKVGALTNLGVLLRQQGDLVQARDLLQTVVHTAPTLAAGHLNLGLTLKAMGNLADAIAHYQQAILLNPNYADAYQSLGVSLLKLGRLPEGLEAFQRAIALHEASGSPEAERLRHGLKELGL